MKKKWTPPHWFADYREHIPHGARAEELMGRLLNDSNLAFTNSIVFAMCCELDGAIKALESLYQKGLLR